MDIAIVTPSKKAPTTLKTPAAPAPTKEPIPPDLGQQIGSDTATECIAGTAPGYASATQHREVERAYFVREIQEQPDFLQVLHAWEAGFDEVMRAAGVTLGATNPAAPAPLSFTDTYGATVTIPAGEVANYAGYKAEHLRTVTQLLAAAGDIDLSGSSIRDLSLIANALTCELESVISIIAIHAADSVKGGPNEQ